MKKKPIEIPVVYGTVRINEEWNVRLTVTEPCKWAILKDKLKTIFLIFTMSFFFTVAIYAPYLVQSFL